MPTPVIGLLLHAAAPMEAQVPPAPPLVLVLPDVTTLPGPPPSLPGQADPGEPEGASVPRTGSAAADGVIDEAGGIVVSGRNEAPKEDPAEQVNLASYEAVQALDRAIVAPVAMGYRDTVPKPIRHGVRNFINNLDEPVAALNFLLQLKPGKAAETIGRFAINSTLGIGGLVDVAKNKPFNLPRRYNGLANTLGYYGVGPGPYLFLPGVGPTTVRDFAGRIIDFSILPRVVGPPLSNTEVSIGKGALGAISDRIADDARIRRLRDQSDDGYGEIRRAYLERRQGEIDALRGKVSQPVPPTSEAETVAAP